MAELTRRVFENAAIGLAILDKQGRFIQVNRAFCRICGHSEKSLLGKSYKDITHPDDLTIDNEHVKQLINGKIEVYNLNKRYIDEYGKVRSVILTASVDRNSEGKVEYFIAQIQDRTNLIRASNDIDYLKNLIEIAFEASSIGSWSWEIDDNTLTWDNNMYKMYGRDARDPVRKYEDFISYIHEKDIDHVKQSIDYALNNNVFEAEFRIKINGQIKYIQARGTLIHDEYRGKTVLAGINTDVTETRQTAIMLMKKTEELEAANKELEGFVYAASHDLKEPLRKISAFGELLSRNLEGRLSSKEKRFFRYTIEGAQKMRQQIDDLLILSRINQVELEIEELDLNKEIESCLEDLAPRIIEADARIKIDKLSPIKGCKPLVRSLLQNILSNAIKYRSPDRELFIHVYEGKREGLSAIFVKDTGIGFDPKYEKIIFEPFKRLHSDSIYQGSGIGLGSCNKVCQRHGWKIGADSELGKGSTFWFTTEQSNENKSDRHTSN